MLIVQTKQQNEKMNIFEQNLLVMKIRIKKAIAVLQHQRLHRRCWYNRPTTVIQCAVLGTTIDQPLSLHYIRPAQVRTKTMQKDTNKLKMKLNAKNGWTTFLCISFTKNVLYEYNCVSIIYRILNMNSSA